MEPGRRLDKRCPGWNAELGEEVGRWWSQSGWGLCGLQHGPQIRSMQASQAAAGLPPGERRAWKRRVPRSEHTQAPPSPQVETEHPPMMPQGPAPPRLPASVHTWGWGRESKRRGALDRVFQSVERARFSSESRGSGSGPGRSRQREVRPGAALALSPREAGKVPAGRAPRRWSPLLPVRDLPGSPVFPVLSSCSVAVLSQAHVDPGSLSTGFSVF